MNDTDSIPEISDTLSGNDDDGVLTAAKRWFLVEANRWLVAGVLTAFVFCTTVLVGAFGPVSVRVFLTEGISPGAALVELLKTIVSLVTIVLSINQLVLSPQLGPVGNQRERLEDAMELREGTEAALDVDVSPAAPGRFLHAVATALTKRTEELDETVREDVPFRAAVVEYVEALTAETERMTNELADARFGEFEVTPIVMTFDTSGKVRRARLLRRRYRKTLTDAEHEALDAVIDTLDLFAVARAYLKTIYIRSEFINFSRALLYIGLPCLLMTFWASQIYDPGAFPGSTLGISDLLWFVSAAVTISLVPFTLLISYVSRLASLSQSTLFIAPFVAGGTDEY